MIVRSLDGTFVFFESHRAKRAKGALLVVHGMGEHSGRYQELTEFALALGLDVHLFDLRGHGRTQGTRGHFPSMEVLHQDMDAWISHLVDTEALSDDLPCFLLGHSLGGLIALTFLSRYVPKVLYPKISGLCLSSPALGLRWTPLKSIEATVARHLPDFLQSFQVPTGINPDFLTHDRFAVKKYREDPLVHSWITPAAFASIEEGIQLAQKMIPSLGLPILFLLSGKDKVVDAMAAESYARKVGVAHPGSVDVRVFHTFFHEPFHEVKKERAFFEFKKWILKCIIQSKRNSSKFFANEVLRRGISP